ncbi:MAG: anthranilate phosphoribosyltransferase [Bacteroidetes bacterium]|nr:anthranilate phosphoribosyltransferase [Bacteroidota bacterium]MDA0874149.1 anthranilate phosphoribosyltransferase [Bacteroidota bacterium]
MKALLTRLAEHQPLSREDTSHAMRLILSGEALPEQIAGFLLGLRARGETPEELTGMTAVMREFAVKVQAPDNAIDIVGTGGDRSGSFNISTTAAFVCAGAGVPVAKHGNRAVSSKSGASDVLAELGVQTDLGKEGVEYCLQHAGMTFLFAPFFHPAMRHVAPVRSALGVRTAFNILGPMCNPAGVKRQLVGAFSWHVASLMIRILQQLGAESVICVHAEDGMDEVSISGTTRVFRFDAVDGTIREEMVHPEQFGLVRADHEAIKGGDAARNAAIIREVLGGASGAPRDIVLLNSAFGLLCAGVVPTVEAGLRMAAESIDSGRAMDRLETLVRVSREAPGVGS